MNMNAAKRGLRQKTSALLRRLGTLRALLFGLAIMLILSTPFADTSGSPLGMGLLWTVVIPASGPLIFMVLMLDFMMCRVLRHEYTDTEQARLLYLAKWNLVLAILLAIVWLPVFLAPLIF